MQCNSQHLEPRQVFNPSELLHFDWKEFIKQTHALIAKDLLPKHEVGVIRQGEVQISGTEYTPLTQPQRLDAELNYLLSVQSQLSNPFDRAIFLHNNIAYLQFFRDCNKRTARNSLTLTLLQNNLFPCVFPKDSYKEYSSAILDYYKNGSFRLFKEYFIQAYEQTAQKYTPKPDPEFTRHYDLKI